MLVEGLERFEEYGAVRIYDVVRVFELDAIGFGGFRGVFVLNRETLEDIAARTVIVVPAKDEEILTLEGVLSAIPHISPVVIVSASSRRPVDRYKHEVELAKALHRWTRRQIMIFHQRDPAWAEALSDTPLHTMIGEDGLVIRGKGEGMILGVLAAAALGAQYVGFIDSDNYVPGAAHEYSWIYYAGFAMAEAKNVMVRILWPYKAVLAQRDVYFRRRGRVSAVTNRMLNYSLSLVRRIETDIVKTANSGEHAMNIELATSLCWAGGFAVEPYELVHLFQYCWLSPNPEMCPILPEGVKILQIEARNPHIHAEKGEQHIAEMLVASLGTIYHSKLADERVKKRIMQTLNSYDIEEEPPSPRIYPPLRLVDPKKVLDTVLSTSPEAHTLEAA